MTFKWFSNDIQAIYIKKYYSNNMIKRPEYFFLLTFFTWFFYNFFEYFFFRYINMSKDSSARYDQKYK